MKLSIISVLRRPLKDQYILLKSLLVVGASLFSNIFGYLFQIIAGRHLSVEDYSILVALFSLSGIVLMPIIFFVGGTTKLVAEVKDQDYPHRISTIFMHLFGFSIIFSTTILILSLVFAPTISNYLKISDIQIIYAFSAAVFAGNVVSFIPPFIQGLMRFKAYSAVIFLTAFTKFLTILYVRQFDLGVLEIFWGLCVTTLMVGTLGIIFLKKNISFRKIYKDYLDIKKIFAYSLLSALGIASIIIMQNLDVIVVKHHFDEALAGIYGSTTVIGRIVFFAASPVAVVMLPICAEKYKKGLDYIKPFFMSLGMTLLIAMSIAGLYLLVPEFTISTLFGEKYLPAVEFLGLYGVYMVLYSILNLFVVFYISISNFKYASIAIIAPIAEYIGLNLYNSTLFEIIYVNIYSTTIAIIILGFLFLRKYQK